MAVLYVFLGFLLVLTLLLFAPVRYRIEGQTGERARVHIDAAWLFKMIRVQYTYEEGKVSFNAWIIGFKKKQRAKPSAAADLETAANAEAASESIPAEELIKADESINAEKSIKAAPPENRNKAPVPAAKPAVKKKKRKKNKPVKWSTLLTDFPLETIMNVVIRFTRKLGRLLKPDRADINGVVGLTDPCATGILLGAYEAAAAYWGVRRYVRISGDFDQPGVRLDARVQGRLRFGSLLWLFIWLFMQKPVFKLITDREKNNKEEEPDGKRQRQQ